MELLYATHPNMKKLMNLCNTRAQGTVLKRHESHVHESYPTQRTPLQIRRFLRCVAFRGVLGNIPVMQSGGDQAVVVMWRNTDHLKRHYAASFEFIDFASFDPKAWAIVV
jgi:tRNA G37 N-methylase TrmD